MPFASSSTFMIFWYGDAKKVTIAHFSFSQPEENENCMLVASRHFIFKIYYDKLFSIIHVY